MKEVHCKMKFKQRIFVVFVVVLVSFVFIWTKMEEKKTALYPVISLTNKHSVLNTLQLDKQYDINNFDLVYRNTKPLPTNAKRNENKRKSVGKALTKLNIANVTSNEIKTINSRISDVEKDPWKLWQEMVRERAITSRGYDATTNLRTIIKALQTFPITQTNVGYRGTQLKASMILKGNQQVVFKPKR